MVSFKQSGCYILYTKLLISQNILPSLIFNSFSAKSKTLQNSQKRLFTSSLHKKFTCYETMFGKKKIMFKGIYM